MQVEVVSFVLTVPVDSTSEVFDECAVPSDLLSHFMLPCSKKKSNIKILFDISQFIIKHIYYSPTYPIVLGKSKVGDSCTMTGSFPKKDKEQRTELYIFNESFNSEISFLSESTI